MTLTGLLYGVEFMLRLCRGLFFLANQNSALG